MRQLKEVCEYITAVIHVCHAKGVNWVTKRGGKGRVNDPTLSAPKEILSSLTVVKYLGFPYELEFCMELNIVDCLDHGQNACMP